MTIPPHRSYSKKRFLWPAFGFLFAAGVFACAFAIFPPDQSRGWEPRRSLGLIFGVWLVLLGGLPGLYRGVHSIVLALKRSGRAPEAAAASSNEPKPDAGRAAAWLCGFLALIVMVVYGWYALNGRFSNQSLSDDYYRQLADAFRHGQLALLAQPDPALAALENPYEPGARLGIPYPWDVSYYGGKYYLYWGPAPVLGQILLEAILPFEVHAAALVIFFASALACSLFGILYALWQRYFRGLSLWAFSAVLATVALGNPILWILSRPAVYEVAILAGQFFLVAGIWLALPVLFRRPVSGLRLGLAGVFWALAVGSRATMAIPVIALAATCGVALLRQAGKPFAKWAALFVPLALGAMALMGYNYTRFGSVFEFGEHYQLTGFDQFHNRGQFFSPAYLGANLYNYLLNPFDPVKRFPFILPVKSTTALPFFVPGTYWPQKVTGILIGLPFLYAIIPWLWCILAPGKRNRIDPALRRFSLLLLLVGFLEFSLLLFFLSNNMRYAFDCIPTLLMLSAIAAWGMLARLREHPEYGWVRWLIAAWMLASVLFSLLLGISGENSQFLNYNPELFQKLSGWIGF